MIANLIVRRFRPNPDPKAADADTQQPKAN